MQHLKLLIAPFLIGVLPSHAADINSARTALSAGRVDEATATLEAAVRSNPKDAASHYLLCRAYYSEDMPDRAVPRCEAAVAADGGTALYHTWLGRAYGQKADKSGPFTGFSMAKRTVAEFERAFALAPTSTEAINDLGEFYARAPGIVGGGTDKARQLAEKIQSTSPALYHRILGLTAEKDKDYAAAERELRKQIEVKKTPEAQMDLLAFFDRRKRVDDAVAVAKEIITSDRTHGVPTFDAATFLTEQKRELPLAEKAFRDYLASPAKSDLGPAFRAHMSLGQIAAARGDSAAAKAEYQAALALAKDYAPAKKAAGM